MASLYQNKNKLNLTMVQANSNLLAQLECARAAKVSAQHELDSASAHEDEVCSRGNATEGQEGRAAYARRQAEGPVNAANKRIKELEDMIEAQTGQRPAPTTFQKKPHIAPSNTSNPELQRARNELHAAEAQQRAAELAEAAFLAECDCLTEGRERRAAAPAYYASLRVRAAKARIAELEAKK